MRETMWTLFVAGAFFSKYYTAGPVELASRGIGEVSVWFAFGPMAVLLATVSQGVWLEPTVLVALPITGFSTLSIQLVGQLIDLPADRESGKLGVAARLGTRVTANLYLATQLGTVATIAALALLLPVSWPLLISAIPYAIFLPKIWKILGRHHADPKEIIPAAGYNVQLHLTFSLLLALGLAIELAVR